MIDFEFDSTPETDAMLKQLCIKECFVRCKDCKYWTENKTTKGSYRNCIFSKTMMLADDFCSRGEKR